MHQLNRFVSPIIVIFLVAFSAGISATPQGESVYINLMPQTRSDYIEVQIVNTSVYNFDMSYLLQGNDSAVNITPNDDPNFPTTCQNDITAQTTCNIWLHSTNNNRLGLVQEGHLTVQVSYDGVVVVDQAFSLANENDLYVGGSFVHAINSDGSQVMVNNIAKWDGTTWSALGSGVTDSSSLLNVYALAPGLDGLIYVGGYFHQAGSTPTNYIAVWDPKKAQWSALGAGLNKEVFALTTDSNGLIYVGGWFSTAGGSTANQIAKWDPVTMQWSTLGKGFAGGDRLGPQAQAIVQGVDGTFYVGGDFTQAGGIFSANNIATWDPKAEQWSLLSNGITNVPGYFCSVSAVTTGLDGSIYAGGEFAQAGGISANNIAKWDPKLQQWAALGNGVNYAVFSLITGVDGSIYAGGEFTEAGNISANHIAKWDPKLQQWSVLGGGVSGSNDSRVFALTTGIDGLIYVGGDFTQAGGMVANNIAQWDPNTQQWSSIGKGLDGDADVLMISRSMLSAIPTP